MENELASLDPHTTQKAVTEKQIEAIMVGKSKRSRRPSTGLRASLSSSMWAVAPSFTTGDLHFDAIGSLDPSFAACFYASAAGDVDSLAAALAQVNAESRYPLFTLASPAGAGGAVL
eukprot:gene7741-418_t